MSEMDRTAQDIIKDMREVVKPCIAKLLKKLNYENCGCTDMAEFETEFEMILTLAEMAVTGSEWIPVSERLPEVALDEYGIRCSKDVLVCDGTDLRVGYFVKNIKRDFNYWVVYGEYYIEPKAWMPLPEPYKASPTGVESEVHDADSD